MADILVIDDEPDTALLFQRRFADEAWQWHFEVDPTRVPTILSAQPIGVVLLDVIMPQRSGLDVLVDIRKIDPTVCVVMMTGLEDMPTIRRALNGGAYDYLTKPINVDDTRRTIQRAFAHHADVAALYHQRNLAMLALRQAAEITTQTLKILNDSTKRRTDRIITTADG